MGDYSSGEVDAVAKNTVKSKERRNGAIMLLGPKKIIFVTGNCSRNIILEIVHCFKSL